DGPARFTLIDCRPTGNYLKAHLPGAVSLPWQEITDARAQALPEGLLITYCWGPSCNAATKGAMLLAAHGRQVKEMIGGLEYWVREGHPTEGRGRVGGGEEKPADGGLPAGAAPQGGERCRPWRSLTPQPTPPHTSAPCSTPSAIAIRSRCTKRPPDKCA